MNSRSVCDSPQHSFTVKMNSDSPIVHNQTQHFILTRFFAFVRLSVPTASMLALLKFKPSHSSVSANMSLKTNMSASAGSPPELDAQPDLTPQKDSSESTEYSINVSNQLDLFAVPSSSQREIKRSMSAERSSKRSHDQIDADINPGESSQHHLNEYNSQTESDDEFDASAQLAMEEAQEPIETATEAGESSQQAARRHCDPVEVESEVGDSSKRPCLEERRVLDTRGFNYMQRQLSPYAAARPCSTQEPMLSRYGQRHNPMRMQDHKSSLASQWENLPSKSVPKSLPNNLSPSGPNPPRPTFNQLATDGQQGMKVLFLIDHATKGDAIHHNLKPFFPSPSSSSELKLLMSKYRIDRSHFQTRYFAKARTICAQLTSRREFLELDTEMEGMVSSRTSRLAYFSEKCSKVHLATLYSLLASAVDIARILLARTPNDRAFKNLMTQVFIHSMEDLWCFELHPSKQDLPAKREKENKEDVYNRFRDLTDREHGLPAARDLPGYLEVPLKASFPRYVLFGQVARPRHEEDVYESDEMGDDEKEGGDIPHPWIPAEVRSRHTEFASRVH